MELQQLGLSPGDAVMVHAAVSRVGPILGGPDVLIQAIRDAVGVEGTVLAYADWNADYEALLEPDGRLPQAWRNHIPGFNPATSRALRNNGVLPEFMRTTSGSKRSGNPGASVVALGGKADWFTADHPLDYGYGEGSPFAKLVMAKGKVLMLGAPLDTMTLLHHAEHLARIPGKHVKHIEVPFETPAETVWTMTEEFETAYPIVDGLAEDYFGEIVRAFASTKNCWKGHIGLASSLLVDAADITAFGVEWLERWAAQ